MERKRLAVLGPGESLSQQCLPPDLQVGDFLEVIVEEVFNPNKFWIRLKGEATSAVLEDLMEQMNLLYDGKSNSLKIPCELVVVGLVCCTLFDDGDWYRVVVKAMVDLTTVEVFYLDYGTRRKMKKDSFRYLLKKFGQLPAQGIEARLAGIKPVDGLKQFKKKTSFRFHQLVRMLPGGLVAQFRGITPKISPPELEIFPPDPATQDHKVSLWLVDTTTNDIPEGIAINQVLVDEGLAEKFEASVSEDGNLTQSKRANAGLTSPSSTERGEELPGLENGQELNKTQKVCCPLEIPDHKVHTVTLEEEAWMTSHEISQLIPSWKGRDLLTRMLELKRICVESKVVTAGSHPELYVALMEEELVRGDEDEVRLYPLKSISQILDILMPAPANEFLKVALEKEITKNQI